VLKQAPCRFSLIGGASWYFHTEELFHEKALESAIRFHERHGDCAASQRAFQAA
jgi:hypothetical protein